MPLPRFSEDDVVQFCVAEALMARGQAEVKNARKAHERKEWISSHKNAAKELGLVPSGGGR